MEGENNQGRAVDDNRVEARSEDRVDTVPIEPLILSSADILISDVYEYLPSPHPPNIPDPIPVPLPSPPTNIPSLHSLLPVLTLDPSTPLRQNIINSIITLYPAYILIILRNINQHNDRYYILGNRECKVRELIGNVGGENGEWIVVEKEGMERGKEKDTEDRVILLCGHHELNGGLTLHEAWVDNRNPADNILYIDYIKCTQIKEKSTIPIISLLITLLILQALSLTYA